MRKNKIFKIMAAVFSVALILSGMTAFAFSAESEATATTETVIEDNRTLTPKGNADLLDDVSDSEDLQFITVTARDGNVFYFVIDHAAENENVYFLNVVDESDLEALAEESEEKPEEKPVTEPEQKEPEPQEPEEPEKEPEKESGGNAGFLVVILLLAGAAGVGAYYYKVVLPKKKLEQADDLEDFEFEEYDEDDTEDTELDETDDEEYSEDIDNE